MKHETDPVTQQISKQAIGSGTVVAETTISVRVNHHQHHQCLHFTVEVNWSEVSEGAMSRPRGRNPPAAVRLIYGGLCGGEGACHSQVDRSRRRGGEFRSL